MKFREKVCGHCGSDLTTAEAIGVREALVDGENVVIGQCPKCHTHRIMVAPEPEVVEPVPEPPEPEPEPEPEVIPEPAPEPEPEPEPPVVRGGRRRVPEPEPTSEPEE